MPAIEMLPRKGHQRRDDEVGLPGADERIIINHAVLVSSSPSECTVYTHQRGAHAR